MRLSLLIFSYSFLFLNAQNVTSSPQEDRTKPGRYAQSNGENVESFIFILFTVLAAIVFSIFLFFFVLFICEECRSKESGGTEGTEQVHDMITPMPSSEEIPQGETDGKMGTAKPPNTGDVRPTSHPTVRDPRIYMWPRRRRPEQHSGEAVTRLLREMETKLWELKEEHQTMDMAFAEKIKQQSEANLDTTRRNFSTDDDPRLKTCQAGVESINDEHYLLSADSLDQTQRSATPDK